MIDTRSLSENWKLEVHDDVFVAIEQAAFPRLRGTMSHPREAELCGLLNRSR